MLLRSKRIVYAVRRRITPESHRANPEWSVENPGQLSLPVIDRASWLRIALLCLFALANEVSAQEPKNPPGNSPLTGVLYYLPEAAFKVELTWMLTNCQLRNGQATIDFAITADVSDKLVADVAKLTT